MRVIVDTSIWYEALRGKKAGALRFVRDIQELLDEGRVVMLGPIRQEILSGVRSTKQFDELKKTLRAFPDLELEAEDYEDTAMAYTGCGEYEILRPRQRAAECQEQDSG